MLPYRTIHDTRFKVSNSSYVIIPYTNTLLSYSQWLREDFLAYLEEWKDSVNKREGFTAAQKQKMMLSRETVEGITISGLLHPYVV